MDQLHANSILFITLDSCRYDSFAAANAPNLKKLGPLYKAEAPGYFTYSSHAAIFMGFTPGVASKPEPFINPKFSKLFKLAGAAWTAKGYEHLTLEGKNIIDGFKRKGFLTVGTAAVAWFDAHTDTGKVLSGDFDRFWYSGDTFSLRNQIDWLGDQLTDPDQPVFAFLNAGETHVPYYYQGAPWDRTHNPCVPFATDNDAGECQRRQIACVEWIDTEIASLLAIFNKALIVICADHGDCWGEDGLWEHGIYHPKVVEVPLIIKLPERPHS